MADNANANPEAITSAQWQQFMGEMAAQNQALAAQLTQANQHIANTNQQLHDAAIEKLEPTQKAEQLQKELDAIRNMGAAAQQQQMSNDVWQRRDAEAAARILMLSGVDVNHPQLYRQAWDVNWMPRFAASVEQVVTQRRNNPQTNNNPLTNPANRANVPGGVSNGIPEIDVDKASGNELIMYALQRGGRP